MRTRFTRLLALLLILLSAETVSPAARANDAKQSGEISNSIGMKFELIPEGEFMMGGKESAEDLVEAFPAYHRPPEYFKDEYPRHRVRITRPFYLGKYEVTVGHSVSSRTTPATRPRPTRRHWRLGLRPRAGKCGGRDPKFNCAIRAFPKPITTRC